MKFADIYRYLTRFHNAIPFHFFPGGGAFPPIHYYFEVTRRCNLRCSMCQYIEWFEQHPAGELMKSELSLDEWKGLVDQTNALGLITFTGGEPWVRQDFEELLAYASQHRRTHFISNGLLLNEDRVRRCAELAPGSSLGRGLCFVGISLDGPPEINDAIRRRDGGFAKAMGNIKALTRLRGELRKPYPKIHVTSVIQEANVDRLHEMPALVAEAGCEVFNLTMEIRFIDVEGLGEIDPEELHDSLPELPRIAPQRLAAALEKTKKAADAAGIELSLPDMPLDQIVRYYDGGLDIGQFACRKVWSNVKIGCEGDVFPCFLWNVGNVRERPLKELWNNERMRSFRRRVRQRPFCICQGCCELEYKGPEAP